ncbi:NAD(P)H-binding protein [Enterobacteriaceae bacterium G50]|nr:NAD(P)H-binding protein [Enterobacteriaceae bacterium G50]
MNPWLIFGAGGNGVGALMLAHALNERRPVYAVVRKPDVAERLTRQGVTVFTGDACDAGLVTLACEAAGANATLLSSMGGAQEYLAHRTVIDAAEKTGLSRMILVTSLGCGDSWRWLSPRAKAAFGQSVREKSLAESWLQTSALDYAILRPGGLLTGDATGNAQRSQNTEVHGFVTRADVAAHAAELANTSELHQQIYSLVDPELKPTRS